VSLQPSNVTPHSYTRQQPARTNKPTRHVCQREGEKEGGRQTEETNKSETQTVLTSGLVLLVHQTESPIIKYAGVSRRLAAWSVCKPRAPPSTVPIPHDAADELHLDDFLFVFGAGARAPAPLSSSTTPPLPQAT
jgi:hypothetical protein